MTNIILILLIVGIVTFLLYKLYIQVFDNTTYEKSTINGRIYRVRKGQNTKEAANRLARLTKKICRLISYINKNKIASSVKCEQLLRRWNKIKIRETGSFDSAAAYTVNKSDELRVCLRNKQNSTFENENTMMFVALHELAHIMSESYGHNKEFMEHFKLLLKAAVDLGIYDIEYFNNKPQDYCGTTISTTPLL